MTRDVTKEKLVRISAAAAAAGVGKQTVEYYIMLGLIEPIRLAGRRSRYFDDALVQRIRLIHRLNETGYALRDIRQTYLERRGRRRPRPVRRAGPQDRSE